MHTAVTEPTDTTRCSARSVSSLTPKTIVASGGSAGGVIMVLPAKDIEHYLFGSGYASVIRKAAHIGGTRAAGRLIRGAVERVSKPGLALQILATADAELAAQLEAYRSDLHDQVVAKDTRLQELGSSTYLEQMPHA